MPSSLTKLTLLTKPIQARIKRGFCRFCRFCQGRRKPDLHYERRIVIPFEESGLSNLNKAKRADLSRCTPTMAIDIWKHIRHIAVKGSISTQCGRWYGMTSEVCLMNSLSVVLAADSATTVEYYGQNGAEKRYFKGANKIFQLSEAHSVGLMIYNSASLLSVPWEVTIKEFRKELADKSFNTVEGFADEFIEWVNASQRLFPDDIRRSGFVQQVGTSMIPIIFDFNKQRQEDGKLEFSNFVDTYIVDKGTVVGNSELSDNEIVELTASTKNDVINEFDKWLGFAKITDVDVATRDKVIEEAIKQALNLLARENNYSGLIFAGFGDHSVFPELVSYSQCKLWGTKFVASGKKVEKVTHDIPAVLSAFAQSSMTDTFESGLSFDVFAKMQETFAGELKSFSESLGQLSEGTVSEGKVNELIGERLKSTTDKIFEYARNEHSLPLRRVLGVLPVDEMAELAETLINLQSLKEKVTKPSETVGGPVDVAAITRSEGLVWIKRKHFFDAGLNSRFFDRRR